MESMEKTGVWGGELELSILSEILNIRFHLHLSDGKILSVSAIEDPVSPSFRSSRLTAQRRTRVVVRAKEPST